MFLLNSYAIKRQKKTKKKPDSIRKKLISNLYSIGIIRIYVVIAVRKQGWSPKRAGILGDHPFSLTFYNYSVRMTPINCKITNFSLYLYTKQPAYIFRYLQYLCVFCREWA